MSPAARANPHTSQERGRLHSHSIAMVEPMTIAIASVQDIEKKVEKRQVVVKKARKLSQASHSQYTCGTTKASPTVAQIGCQPCNSRLEQIPYFDSPAFMLGSLLRC